MRSIVRFQLLLLPLLLVGCAHGPSSLPEAQSQPAQLYAEKCSACHALPHPARHTTAQWQHLVSLMEQRIRERNMEPLNQKEKQTILAYLESHGRKP